jgi:hypothetical protein
MSLQDLYMRLPTRDAIVLYVNFRAVEQAGLFQILSDSRVTEDPEYRLFVQKTEFDYTHDLDSALVSFAPTGKYLLATGRFEWKTLRSYAVEEGGQCMTARCDIPGSKPDRRISFSPLQRNVMAMAVTPQPDAVRALMSPVTAPPSKLPQAPIWLRIPGSVLRSGNELPTGTQMFARKMERADSIILSFTADGDRLGAHLDVMCQNADDAASIAKDLTDTTTFLRQMIEREHHDPNPADLSGVLTSGAFRTEGTKVLGYWPIERSFVANVLAGSVN